MTEVAGDLHCLACGYVADVPMEAWDECEAQKDARITELEAELAFSQDQRIASLDQLNGQTARAEQAEAEALRVQHAAAVISEEKEQAENERDALRTVLQNIADEAIDFADAVRKGGGG